MTGQRVGNYEVAELVGRGAMGDVYRAKDTVLGREVALKFLPAQAQAGDEQRASFLQEARNAAAVEHPNIATVYEIGDAGNGRPFIAMPFYAGQTLAARIENGPVAIEDAIRWSREIATGLAHAHSLGLAHRDIKPANLALDADQSIKILDFGVAQLGAGLGVSRGLTSSGTAAYMSPEQAQHASVDHRTDIWSLGVVLYQMLTGELPFKGSYDAAISYSILNESPALVEQLRPEAPPALSETVQTALAKEPGERFQSAAEFVSALDGIELTRSGRTENPVSGLPSVAVLPFANVGGAAEGEYFSDGLTEEIITTLSRLDGLHVVSRTSAFQFKGQSHDVRDVGRQLNVASVLEGSVRASGERIRVTVQLVDTENGFQRWSERFDRELEDVFAIQDEIAQSVAARLRANLDTAVAPRSGRPSRANADAYDAYLRGRQLCSAWSHAAFVRARDNFDAALVADPRFAPAHSGLADLYVLRGFWGIIPPSEAWPAAKKHALRALDLDEGLAEAHTSLGAVQAVFDRDFVAAEQSFQRAIQLRPSYVMARDFYARFFLAPMGRADEALKQMQLAVELDPLCPMRSSALGWGHLTKGETAAVRECVARVFELAPGYIEGYWLLANAEYLDGNREAAAQALRDGWESDRANPQALAGLGRAEAMLGNRAGAERVLTQMRELSESQYISPIEYAWVTVALGDYEETISYIEKAYEEFDAISLYSMQTPVMAPLRGHPRFQKLAKRMGLPVPNPFR